MEFDNTIVKSLYVKVSATNSYGTAVTNDYWFSWDGTPGKSKVLALESDGTDAYEYIKTGDFDVGNVNRLIEDHWNKLGLQ